MACILPIKAGASTYYIYFSIRLDLDS